MHIKYDILVDMPALQVNQLVPGHEYIVVRIDKVNPQRSFRKQYTLESVSEGKYPIFHAGDGDFTLFYPTHHQFYEIEDADIPVILPAVDLVKGGRRKSHRRRLSKRKIRQTKHKRRRHH